MIIKVDLGIVKVLVEAWIITITGSRECIITERVTGVTFDDKS
jgi:hypothetical protein